MSILNQPNKIPQAVIANGLVTGNTVQNPDNLLNTTDQTAIFGPTSDVIVGNFPFNIPLDAVIVGISGILKARLNDSSIPPGSITPVLVDASSGSNIYYPGAAITGFSGVLQEYAFGGAYDVWANIGWTAEKINNLKLQLIGNSALEVAWATLTVYYYIPVISPIPTPFDLPGCADCDSVIQALPFELAQTWEASGPNQNKLVLKSFNLPSGEPITLDMIGECGGSINVTIDPDLRREDGENFIENFNIDADLATISTLPNGYIQIDLGDFNQRGLDFITPYGHLDDNVSEHSVGAVVIITNNGPYEGKLLKRCHIGTLVSAPIETQDEGSTVVVATEIFNFIGPNVQAEQDSGNPRKANITVVANATNVQPTEEDTNTGTNDTTPTLTLTVPLTIVDANYLRVGVITEDETITSVEYDGVAMTFIGEEINPGSNLKVALFGLINPNVGAHNAVVTMPTPRIITAIVTSWLDVDTTNPVDGVSSGNLGTDTAPTDTATTTTQNSVMQDVVGTTNNPTTFTQFGLWSIQGSVTTGDRPGASSSRLVLAPQTVTDIYQLSLSTGWAILLAGIRGISAPSPTDDHKVAATGADTVPNYLDDKIEIVSTDLSVGITKTIQNPGANEKISYDLSSSGVLSFDYQFDDTVGGTPAIGFVTYEDNSNPALVTQVNINNTDGNGNVITADLGGLVVGQQIRLNSTDNPGNFSLYNVVSVNNIGAVTQITVTYANSNNTFANNENLTLDILPFTPSGDDKLVAVSATDTTPDYLDPKINIHSSDSSVNVNTTVTNPGGNEILDIDLTVPPPVVTSGVSTQYLFCDIEVNLRVPSSIASLNADASVIFVAYYKTGTALYEIVRYERDAQGAYIQTHSVASGTAADSTFALGIVALGSFVYVSHSNGVTHKVTRFAAADLTGETDMTVSGTDIGATARNQGCFTDGTFLYFYDNNVASGNRRKYSLSGTTITFVSNITFGTNELSAFCDTTNVYLLDYQNGVIEEYDLTGTLLFSFSYPLNANTPGFDNTSYMGGMTYLTSTALYISLPMRTYDNTGITQRGLYMIPIAKP